MIAPDGPARGEEMASRNDDGNGSARRVQPLCHFANRTL